MMQKVEQYQLWYCSEKIFVFFENNACILKKGVLLYLSCEVNSTSGFGEVWYRA